MSNTVDENNSRSSRQGSDDDQNIDTLLDSFPFGMEQFEDFYSSNEETIDVVHTHTVSPSGEYKFFVKMNKESYKDSKWIDYPTSGVNKTTVDKYLKLHQYTPPAAPYYNPDFNIPVKIIGVENDKYHVMWKNLPIADATWETRDSLKNDKLINDYLRQDAVQSKNTTSIANSPYAQSDMMNHGETDLFQIERMNRLRDGIARILQDNSSVIYITNSPQESRAPFINFIGTTARPQPGYGRYLIVTTIDYVSLWEQFIPDLHIDYIKFVGTEQELVQIQKSILRNPNMPNLKYQIILTTFDTNIFCLSFKWNLVILDDSSPSIRPNIANVVQDKAIQSQCKIFIVNGQFDDYHRKMYSEFLTDPMHTDNITIKSEAINKMYDNPFTEYLIECNMEYEQYYYYFDSFLQNKDNIKSIKKSNENTIFNNLSTTLHNVCNHPAITYDTETIITRYMKNNNISLRTKDVDLNALISSSAKLKITDKIVDFVKNTCQFPVVIIVFYPQLRDFLLKFFINKGLSAISIEKDKPLDTVVQPQIIIVLKIAVVRRNELISNLKNLLRSNHFILYDTLSQRDPQTMDDIKLINDIRIPDPTNEVSIYRLITKYSIEALTYGSNPKSQNTLYKLCAAIAVDTFTRNFNNQNSIEEILMHSEIHRGSLNAGTSPMFMINKSLLNFDDPNISTDYFWETILTKIENIYNKSQEIIQQQQQQQLLQEQQMQQMSAIPPPPPQQMIPMNVENFSGAKKKRKNKNLSNNQMVPSLLMMKNGQYPQQSMFMNGQYQYAPQQMQMFAYQMQHLSKLRQQQMKQLQRQQKMQQNSDQYSQQYNKQPSFPQNPQIPQNFPQNQNFNGNVATSPFPSQPTNNNVVTSPYTQQNTQNSQQQQNNVTSPSLQQPQPSNSSLPTQTNYSRPITPIDDLTAVCRVTMKWMKLSTGYDTSKTPIINEFIEGESPYEEKFSDEFKSKSAKLRLKRIKFIELNGRLLKTADKDEDIAIPNLPPKYGDNWTPEKDRLLMKLTYEKGLGEVTSSDLDMDDSVNPTERFNAIMTAIDKVASKLDKITNETVKTALEKKGRKTALKSYSDSFSLEEHKELIKLIDRNGFVNPDLVLSKTNSKHTREEVMKYCEQIIDYCFKFVDGSDTESLFMSDKINDKTARRIYNSITLMIDLKEVLDQNALINQTQREIVQTVLELGYEDAAKSDIVNNNLPGVTKVRPLQKELKKILHFTKVINKTALKRTSSNQISNNNSNLSEEKTEENSDEVTFPIILNSTLRVISLGTVDYTRENYHTQRYIYCIGFVSERLYASIENPNEKAWYRSLILDGGEMPLFRVELKDNPEYFWEGPKPTSPWSAAIKDIERKRSILGFKSHSVSVSGPESFGFAAPKIISLISKLPNADKCKKFNRETPSTTGMTSETEESHLSKKIRQIKQEKESDLPILLQSSDQNEEKKMSKFIDDASSSDIPREQSDSPESESAVETENEDLPVIEEYKSDKLVFNFRRLLQIRQQSEIHIVLPRTDNVLEIIRSI
ncbi:F/Y-rich N-terminus family protein [Trichomonas vaginalis G3]|uniref:F/Y-rich N-terminus family protein n=1 Tax=Trichomonas vaginalis (strain ATCC PRA-98 / G3) TaxID=412133 RepID=A2ESD4_TRIV3|nr:histone methyltransferase activity (H3-K4 specific) [Trichomonas vaginalis G3]EAY04437.1 F/Y-rich N-terminus family protein [Trichomonas vaginalis G3]KAI5502201.1 histone methyltransferase activity (H3-K4 specific) [Trichomonas vaginalis G3]|eukprot:XP_001316660.1 F/Y-rich N-terminus family protein [Trichomonas vaginalis G3]